MRPDVRGGAAESAADLLELPIAAQSRQRGQQHAQQHDRHTAHHGQAGRRGQIGRFLELTAALEHQRHDRAHTHAEPRENRTGQRHADAYVTHTAQHVGHSPCQGKQIGFEQRIPVFGAQDPQPSQRIGTTNQHDGPRDQEQRDEDGHKPPMFELVFPDQLERPCATACEQAAERDSKNSQQRFHPRLPFGLEVAGVAETVGMMNQPIY